MDPVVAGLVCSSGGGDGFGFGAVTGCCCVVRIRKPLALCVAGGGGLCAAGPDSAGAVAA